MNREICLKLEAMAMEPSAQEASIQYLAEHLGNFLRLREHVFICFQEHKPGNLSWLMEQAVLRCEAIAHVWGPDHRWKELLRQAFLTRSTTIIGEPLLLLGLTKLKKASDTPLYVRKVVTAGYPMLPWMIEGIVRGFDCEVGGCYSLGRSGVVAGFACGRSWGVHLRDEVYGAEVVDEEGNRLPEKEMGEIVLYPQAAPHLRYHTGENGQLILQKCRCGSSAPRLLEFIPGKTEEDPDLLQLGQDLQSWTSILDCRLQKGEYGLEMELVVFPGEKLPKLPTAAKMLIRNLDLETQEPFPYDPVLKNSDRL